MFSEAFFLGVIKRWGLQGKELIALTHRCSFCDDICQVYYVIYIRRDVQLFFHTEHHQSSFISNFHIFCHWNENDDGLSYSAVIYLSTGIYDFRNRYVLEDFQGFELGRQTIFLYYIWAMAISNPLWISNEFDWLAKHYTQFLKTVCPWK